MMLYHGGLQPVELPRIIRSEVGRRIDHAHGFDGERDGVDGGHADELKMITPPANKTPKKDSSPACK